MKSDEYIYYSIKLYTLIFYDKFQILKRLINFDFAKN